MKTVSVLCLALLLAASGAHAGEFAQPRPGLHTGGQPTAQDLADLRAQGVATIIDLRGADEDRGYAAAAEAQRLGLRYVVLPIAGKDDITPANAARLQALLDASGDGVLLHCASGNRVGALLALAAQQQGKSVEEALQIGRDAGLKSLEPVVAERLQAQHACTARDGQQVAQAGNLPQDCAP